MSNKDMILDKLKAAALPGRVSRKIMPMREIRRGDAGVFTEKAMAAAAQVIRTSTAEVPDQIREILQETACQSLVLTEEAIIKEFALQEIAVEMGIDCQFTNHVPPEEYRSHMFQVQVGISGCDYALADSGTIVIFHEGDKQRLVSLAPDHYIALVKGSQLLKDRFDLAAILEKEGRTPAVTLITGVSRTADVALQVVLGMHGPRKVYIVLIEE